MKAIHLLCLLPLTAQAAQYQTGVLTVNAPIPDNDRIGLSTSVSVVTTTITSIEDVKVNLEMANGWGGDLYCYLIHDGGFSVLLNRVGRNDFAPGGSGNDRLSIALFDAAATDVHVATPTTGTLSGDYRPDARKVDPATSTESTPRTATLGGFIGLNPNGEWTLFVADVASGETMTLQSWSMTINGVPEPSTAMLLGVTAGLLVWRRRR